MENKQKICSLAREGRKNKAVWDKKVRWKTLVLRR